jgi:hypothetical protein
MVHQIGHCVHGLHGLFLLYRHVLRGLLCLFLCRHLVARIQHWRLG